MPGESWAWVENMIIMYLSSLAGRNAQFVGPSQPAPGLKEQLGPLVCGLSLVFPSQPT